MASGTGSGELDAREAEAEAARARLSNTLETLASPEVQGAAKADIFNHVQSYKDELLRHVDEYKSELLQKADEYKGELLDRVEAYKGEVMERAESYKGEFLTRADEYKNEALQRAEAYKDEALKRVRAAGRETMHNIVEDLKTRATNSPEAVALIGAGVGWRLYKHPPITTLLLGAGAALLLSAPGRSGRNDRRSRPHGQRDRSARSDARHDLAGMGPSAEDDSSWSSATEHAMAIAASAGMRAREAVSEAGSRLTDAAGRTGEAAGELIERARPRVAAAAEDAGNRAQRLIRTAQQSPLLLALAGIVAGVAVARSVRGTETGDQLVREGTEALGRGARQVGGAANQAVDAVVDLASTATPTVGDATESVRTRVADIAAGSTNAARRARDSVADLVSSTTSGSAAPSSQRENLRSGLNRGQRKPDRFGVRWRARRKIGEMGERYPVLLGTTGLVVGAVVGAALQRTDFEDRSIGSATDTLKRRAKQTVSEELKHVMAAAGDVISAIEGHFGEQGKQGRTEPYEGREPQLATQGTNSPRDTEKNSVVIEREESVEAQASQRRDDRT